MDYQRNFPTCKRSLRWPCSGRRDAVIWFVAAAWALTLSQTVWSQEQGANPQGSSPANASVLNGPSDEEPQVVPTSATSEPYTAEYDEIAALIEQLGDPNYHRRLSAEWKLERLGLTAFEQLRLAAANHKNIQVANAARYIIESQNIIWHLETDSVEVRSYLSHYSDASPDKREESILMLGKLDTVDAHMALCRLARYERDEVNSKIAALTLMELLSEKDNISDVVSKSIEQSIGDSNRPAVQWIRLFLQNVAGETDNLQQWVKLAEAEIELVEEDPTASVRDLSRRYCRWLSAWLTRNSQKDFALEAISPLLLALVEENQPSVKNMALWALDEGMPEFLLKLAEKHKAPFDQHGELAYLLAECHRMLGNQEEAERLAAYASEIAGPTEAAGELAAKHRRLAIVEYNRFRLAEGLEARGLIDWAEREYQKALAEDTDRYEIDIRLSFSLFYWFGGQPQKAADVLKPLVTELADVENSTNRDARTSKLKANRSDILSNYHYYLGLAHTQQEDWPAAWSSLETAYGFDPRNPDIVIAMQQAAFDSEARETAQSAFEQMRSEFRTLVVDEEKRLSSARGRNDRRNSESALAFYCNQLAWLLCSCRSDPDEAIQLSLRSLELEPDRSIYLDTLGRCYFAAEKLQLAVDTQKKAVRIAPHERQMAAQLAEFEEALAAAKVLQQEAGDGQ